MNLIKRSHREMEVVISIEISDLDIENIYHVMRYSCLFFLCSFGSENICIPVHLHRICGNYLPTKF